MTDKRSHRGPHPGDGKLFGESALPALRDAASDFCWLLNRGYADNSALKLVGDRYRLTKRQRVAVARAACTDEALANRQARQLLPSQLAGQNLWLDGFNVLVTIEAALSGGVVLQARDGCFRDLASMHGTYRKVAETAQAITLVGQVLEAIGAAKSCWLFDRPVSNSGRVKAATLELARRHNWNWEVELVPDPDRELVDAENPIATADHVVLDRCSNWFNLARLVVERRIAAAWIVDLA